MKCAIALSVILLSVSACGGGSADSTPAAVQTKTTPAPSISATPSPVSATAVVTDPAPSATVNLTFANVSGTIFLSVDDTTTNGIASVGTPTFNSTSGSFTINFKSPVNLKPADYTDTLTVLLCSDAQCKVVLASQPLQVTYTVKAATGSSAPSVTLDSTTQTFSALYIQTAPSPSVNLDPVAFTFANFPGTPNVQVSAPTTGGVVSPTFVMKDATHGGIAFTFAPPSGLSQQTYTTPVTVNVCIDPNCVNLVQSFTLTLDYTVTNKITVAGDNGYSISAYPLAANLLASNPNLTRVLAVVAPGSGATTNSIESIDPTSGTSTLPPFVLSESPNTAAALADDGSFLYVAGPTKIQQVQTSTLSGGYTIDTTALTNTTLAVQPGHPQTIAVAYNGGMQIFDSGHPRTNPLQLLGYRLSAPAWTSSDPNILGARRVGNTLDLECSFSIDANGFTSTANSQCAGVAANLVSPSYLFAGGFGYSSTGVILKEADWTVAGTLPTADSSTSLSGVLPDSTTTRAYAFASSTTSCNLQSFSLSTNAQLATLALPIVASGNCGYSNLVRWGTNGLAFTTGTDLVVVSGKFVAP